MQTLQFTRHIPHTEMGLYFELPFEVPEGVCRIDIEYDYTRYVEHTDPETGNLIRDEVNIVDIALAGPSGYIGASGSKRNHIWVQAAGSIRGYANTDTIPGTWKIIAGAYKIWPHGLDVHYTVRFTPKRRRRYYGDTHMHTTGSDGSLRVLEIAEAAKKSGLDYIILTDHNDYAHNDEIPAIEGITAIPGMEWTHYRGHAGIWGVPRAVKSPFCINDDDAMAELLHTARQNGAVVVLNHPQCPDCGWQFDLAKTEYDLLEIWNGGLEEEHDRLVYTIQWWHEMLVAGKHQPICGGSDFHEPFPMRSVGMPCTVAYALSNAPADILAALKEGCSYVTVGRNGPGICANIGNEKDGPDDGEMAEGCVLGRTVPKGTAVQATFTRLKAGDEVRAFTDKGSLSTHSFAQSTVAGTLTFQPMGARFLRFEVWRSSHYYSGAPIMVSNPVYFE